MKRIKRLNEALPGLLCGIVIYAILAEAIGIWFFEDKIRYTTGLIIGVGCAIFMGVHIAMIIEESVRIGEGHEKLLAIKSVIRYLVVVEVFMIMMRFNLGNLISGVIGVIGLKASAYAQPLLYKFFHRKEESESLEK